MDGFGKTFLILRTKVTGNDHTCTGADAIEQTDQEEDEAARRADRRQRLTAQQIAYNQCIRRIIKLLKKIAQKDRHRKSDHLLPDRAFCQPVFCILQGECLLVCFHWILL